MPTAPPVSHPTRSSYALRFLALGAFLWLLWTAFRSRQLLAKGGAIAAHSQNFSFDYFIGDSDQPGFTYCVMGDSTAAGWGAAELEGTYPFQVADGIAAAGHRVHVVNIAVGGATLRGVVEHQLAELEQLRPDLVTLSIGANDATHFTAPGTYRSQWHQVLQILRASSAGQILIANTPDMYLAPALPLPLALATSLGARRQNAALSKALAELGEGSRFKIVDLFGRGKLNYHRDKSLYAADLFHPSARGYKLWAALFIEKWRR